MENLVENEISFAYYEINLVSSFLTNPGGGGQVEKAQIPKPGISFLRRVFEREIEGNCSEFDLEFLKNLKNAGIACDFLGVKKGNRGFWSGNEEKKFGFGYLVFRTVGVSLLLAKD